MPLTLEFAGIELELRVFNANSFPRERPTPLTYSQSRNDATLLEGPSFEPKHVWTIATIVGKADLLLLQDMHGIAQITPGEIVVTDTISEYTEPTPRTRPLATGTSATTIGSRVRYFAEFNAVFNSALTVTTQPDPFEEKYEASFQLLESTKRLTV